MLRKIYQAIKILIRAQKGGIMPINMSIYRVNNALEYLFCIFELFK